MGSPLDDEGSSSTACWGISHCKRSPWKIAMGAPMGTSGCSHIPFSLMGFHPSHPRAEEPSLMLQHHGNRNLRRVPGGLEPPSHGLALPCCPFSFWGEFCCFHSSGCSAATRARPSISCLSLRESRLGMGAPGWGGCTGAGEGGTELERVCRSWGRHFGTGERHAVTEMGCRSWKTGYRAGEKVQGWQRVLPARRGWSRPS